MARGWGRSEEDLGAEKEQARTEREKPRGPISREEASREARRRTIEMSLARIREELEKTSHPERRAALEAARRELEEKLKEL